MKFSVDSKIFDQFPGVSIGMLVIDAMDPKGSDDDVLSLLRDIEQSEHERLRETNIAELPEIAAWRSMYKAFGSDPREYRSSIEALLRRVKQGKTPLPQIHPLVDLYNYISLKYHLPVGAEDLEQIQGDLTLRYAIGTEKSRVLGSLPQLPEDTCEKGEIIYADGLGFVCRRWNWREADRTKITIKTTKAVVVMEKVAIIHDDVVRAALEEMGEKIKRHLNASYRTFIIDSSLDMIQLS